MSRLIIQIQKIKQVNYEAGVLALSANPFLIALIVIARQGEKVDDTLLVQQSGAR